METIKVKIDGRVYRLFRFTACKGKPCEQEVTVAEHRLEALIQRKIRQELYHEVKEVDEMYGYYLPAQINTKDETAIRESIEDAIEFYNN